MAINLTAEIDVIMWRTDLGTHNLIISTLIIGSGLQGMVAKQVCRTILILKNKDWEKLLDIIMKNIEKNATNGLFGHIATIIEGAVPDLDNGLLIYTRSESPNQHNMHN